jgi:hypothetical protein
MRPGRLVEAVAVTGLGLLLTAILTFPVAARFSSGGRVDTGDGHYALWNVAWVARTIVTQPTALYNANIFYPHRQTLAYSEANVVAGALAVPAYWLTLNPYAAYNSVLFMTFTAAFVSMYYMVRYLAGRRDVGVLAGIAFAFAPYIFARIPHIQLQMTAVLPLSLLAFHRLVDRPTLERSVALGLILAVAALACAYYGIFLVLTIGLGTFWFAAARGLWRQASYWVAIAGAGAVSIAIVLPFFLPYLEIQRDTGFTRTLSDARMYEADWRAYFASSAWAHRWMLPLIVQWREVLFPGFLTTILGVTGIVLAVRNRRGSGQDAPAGAAIASRNVPLFYAAVGALALWASLGPSAGLYTVFYYTLPIFSWIRAPGRFGIMVTLALVILAAQAGAWLLGRRSQARQRTLVLVAGVALVAELASIPIRWRDALPVPEPYRVLATLPPGPVVILPFWAERMEFHRHAEYMLYSTANWRPMLNGYSDHIPDDFRRFARGIAGFPTRGAFSTLEWRQLRYVIVHLEMYNLDNRQTMIDRLEVYRSFLRPIVATGNVRMYEIVGWPR